MLVGTQSSTNPSGTKASIIYPRPNSVLWECATLTFPLEMHTRSEKMPSAFPSAYLSCSPIQIRITSTAHLRLGQQFQWELRRVWSSKTSRITWDLKLMLDTSSVSLSWSVPCLNKLVFLDSTKSTIATAFSESWAHGSGMKSHEDWKGLLVC